MGFKPLTINTPIEEPGHIYAQDEAAIYQSIIGVDGVLDIGSKFKCTVISNNLIRISDGILNTGGHLGRIDYGDYEDVVIENGADGYYRNDIIYAKFVNNGDTDLYSIQVKKGTAVTENVLDPDLVQGDMYQGAVEREVPLYRVKMIGLSIDAVECMFETIPTMPTLLEKIKALEEENSALNNALEEFKTYSSEEQVIGTWIDGKPLYRLVFSGSATGPNSTYNNWLDVSDKNIDTITKLYGITKQTNSSMNYVREGIAIWRDNVILGTQLISSGSLSYTYTCFLEYTKTTD